MEKHENSRQHPPTDEPGTKKQVSGSDTIYLLFQNSDIIKKYKIKKEK
ncbi:MAG: hypothetical protein HFI25_10550 [Lachnospiraceae bacterium]|nr:hypothetical protein [Lachnospiraceae bacterium]GFI09123.1 hypothetical protein IMSAGC007_01581 [Lachnospiraceae bacterium]